MLYKGLPVGCPLLSKFFELVMTSKSWDEEVRRAISRVLEREGPFTEELTSGRAFLVIRILQTVLCPIALKRAEHYDYATQLQGYTWGLWRGDEPDAFFRLLRTIESEFSARQAEYDLSDNQWFESSDENRRFKLQLSARRLDEAKKMIALLQYVILCVQDHGSDYAQKVGELFFAAHEIIGASSDVFILNAERLLVASRVSDGTQGLQWHE